MNKWERLIFTLELLNRDSFAEPVDIKQIDNEIYYWDIGFNRVLSQPTEKQINAIKQLYMKFGSALNSKSNAVIQFTLKSYAFD